MFFEKYSALYTSDKNSHIEFIREDSSLNNCFTFIYGFIMSKFGKEINNYEIDIVRKQFISKTLNFQESIHFHVHLHEKGLYIVIKHNYAHWSDVLTYIDYRIRYDKDGKEYYSLNVQYSLFSSDSMLDEVIDFVKDISKRLRINMSEKENKK